jgi:hypothetical protein
MSSFHSIHVSYINLIISRHNQDFHKFIDHYFFFSSSTYFFFHHFSVWWGLELMPAPGGLPFKLKEKEDEIHIYIETYKTYSNDNYTSKGTIQKHTVHIKFAFMAIRHKILSLPYFRLKIKRHIFLKKKKNNNSERLRLQ